MLYQYIETVYRQLATEPTRHKFNQLATQLEATRHIRNVNLPQCSLLATQLINVIAFSSVLSSRQ